jgi:DNA-binding SARP family transcriptional activator/predicted ATPase
VAEVAPVEVMLLGAPQVRRDGAPVAFDTRKALALLAHLALTDRARPRDVLAELLWPDHDADHARGALRRTLSTLRGAVGAEAVEATRDRVALVRGPELAIDVDRFRALAGAGALEDAVAVFGGDFLEGFGLRDAPAFEDWQRGEAEGLRRELAGVLGRLVDACEGARDWPAALAYATRWLALDTLHEPAHRALIRLHALRGDRAAALEQYRDCVRTLSSGLGVPPLQETTALYEAISEGTLEPPVGVRPLGQIHGAAPFAGEPARTAGSDPSRLVGRDAERAALVERFDGMGGEGRVVVLEGEAGIGKTRLADELLTHVRERGAPVLVGRAYEEEAGLAYGPIVEALQARLRADAGWADDAAPRALAEAARLVPELAEARPGLPEPPALDGPAAQVRFFDGVWETLVAAAGGGAIFVDDVQWADEATLALLAYGLRRLAGRPLLVLLAWRTPFEPPLRRVVGEAARGGTATVLQLDRLGPGDVGELLAAVRPEAAGEPLARRLYEETEGIPFLLVEYLRALGPAAEGEWPLPPAARDVLRARVAATGEVARQVLAAAAVIGRSFDVETVRAASGRGDEETVTAIEELLRRGLVREGAADYDFAHERLRALVYEETSLARRRLLHARAATSGPAAAVARHLALAGRDAEAAHAYARAADDARRVYANAEALEHLQSALALGHPDRGVLQTALGDLQTLRGDYGAALAAYRAAAADAPSGALEQRLGQVHQRRGEWTLAERHFRAALDATADPAARARIFADLSLTAQDGGDPERAAALAAEALALAEEAGEPRALGQAHNLLGMLEGSLDHLARSLALAEEVGDAQGRMAALNNLALAHRERGDLQPALELTDQALALCTELGDRHREAALRNNRADLLHAGGRHDEAMDELKRAVAIFAEIGAEGPRPEVWKLARW